MALLKVNHIEKHFGSTRVLEDIGFTVEKGEVVAIIGSSGSGKTTLLRCLNFLETPDQGQIILNDKVLFDAEDPSTMDKKEVRKKRLHFGLVFQNFNLFPHFTVLRNITEAQVHVLGRSKAQAQQRGRELLAKMGLSDKENSYPCELSGGQQQRVSIARALALDPQVLFFDEPTSALDPELTGEILKVIRELAQEHMTMVVVTHEMAFARDLSDRIIFMDGGVIVEQGPAQEVINNPQQERTKAFLSRFQS
jgi:polar amino acid transport system ATP-binding protein